MKLDIHTTVSIDRKRLSAAIETGRARSLKRAGAIVRGVARRSIRRRKKKVSSPGSQPFAHMPGNAGLKLILFAYDPASQSVAVGPIAFGTRHAGELERGGTVTTRVTRKRRGKVERQTVQARIAARPFMRPALDVSRGKLPEVFARSIR